MKRLCIYVIYDEDGIIDEYIDYMLRKIKEHVTKLVVVCNFRIISSGESYLKHADSIFFRENTGYDFGAWKDVLCKHLGWECVHQYDELILSNDSFFGPFYSFLDVFNTMDKQPVDFWGLTEHPGGEHGGVLYDAHLQSFFYCFKSDILHSIDFFDYWNSMEYPQEFIDAVLKVETKLTLHFMDAGYRYSSYMMQKLPNYNKEWNVNPTASDNYKLIVNGSVPILKRKSICFYYDGFEETLSAIDYIRSNTDYDVSLIWNYIFKLFL